VDADGTSLAPFTGRGATMDTFFVRKQIVVGFVLLVVIEMCVTVVRLFAR
jgi:hypothetical protein